MSPRDFLRWYSRTPRDGGWMTPPVEVIVVAFGAPDLLDKCLDSLVEHSRSSSWAIRRMPTSFVWRRPTAQGMSTRAGI